MSYACESPEWRLKKWTIPVHRGDSQPTRREEMLLEVLFPGEKVYRCLSIGKVVRHRLYHID